MEGFLSDVRWTLRLIRRRPAFASTVIATLAVAIASVVTAFGVATAVLWRPLPFGEPDRLVFAWENTSDAGAPSPARVTGFRFEDWRRGNSSLESIALFGSTGFLVDRAGGAEIVNGVRVSTNYFDTLRIGPALGRTFAASDGEPGNDRVVILSHALWQQWFGGRTDIVGTELRLGRQPYTIVGVMPPAVLPAWPVNPAVVTLDPESRRLWVPIARTPALAASARAHVFGVVARLRTGRSIADASRELSGMADAAEPDRHGAVLRPFRDQFVHDARSPLLALLGAALAVLLVACTNLAALQGSVIESRRAELSMRAALGAARGRLARQFATEAAILAGAGGGLGLVIAQLALARIPGLLPASVPLLTPPSLDAGTVLFAAAASVCAALALASWPFARSTATSAAPAPRGTASAARNTAFRLLVAAQVAVAVALVASAALLQRSLDTVRGRDAGFAIDRVLTGSVTLAGAAYSDPAQVIAAERRLAAGLARIPGARAAAFAYDHPLEANWTDSFTLSGAAGPADDARDSAQLRIVSPNYFETMEVSVIDGRALGDRDDLNAAGAVVVNEAFARRIGGALLGRTIRSAVGGSNWTDSRIRSEFRIVGVVENERFKGLELPSEPAIYMSLRQFPQRQMTMLLRTGVEPESLAPAAREAIRRIDPQMPVGPFSALSSILAEQLVTRRATTQVIDAFAAGALALAGLGLYGLLALLVSGRARETAIRLALGSSPLLEAGRVLRECVASVGAGVAAGVGLALLSGRLVQSLLVGVSPRDPATLAVVCLTMLAVAVAAAARPAWRASRVDPAAALRGAP